MMNCQRTHAVRSSISILAVLSILMGIFTAGHVFHAGAETQTVPSVVFNHATQSMLDSIKLDGTATYAAINTDPANMPQGAAQSLRFGQSAAVSKYPAMHFWQKSGGNRSFGPLFGTTDASQYEGIRLWVKKGSTFGFSRLLVFIDNRPNGSEPAADGNSRYVYSITGSQLTAAGGYVDIPFSDFHLNRDPSKASYDPAVSGSPNYIAFQSGDGGAAKVFECFIADLQLYGGSGGTQPPVDPGDGYEYIPSSTFNASTQEQWNSAYFEGASTYATVQLEMQNKPVSASRSVKIGQHSESSGYIGTLFWNNANPADRKPFGNLFGDADATQYQGIKIWLKKGDMPYPVIRIRIGRMGSGGWWPSGGAFYTCSLQTSSIPDEGGYFLIPFSDFLLSGTSVAYDPSSNGAPNFIGFQTGDGSKKTCDFYASDLQLYRETGGGKEEPDPPPEYPKPDPDDASNPANPAYTYVPSDVFNFAAQEQWNQTKIEGTGTLRTVDLTEENKQASAYQSMKLHYSGVSNYASVFFWNETAGRKPYGDLFGSLNTSKCLGIRIYIKTTDHYQFQTLKVFLDRIGSTAGYYKSEDKTFIAQLQLTPGFSGYVDIPFTSFIRASDGATYQPAVKPDHIAFKLVGGPASEDDIWFSNLFAYYESAGDVEPAPLTDIPLDRVTYEYIPSSRFNDASQEQWDETKRSGAGTQVLVNTEPGHVPTGLDRSFCFHTAGDTKSPEVYFWREYTGEDGKASRSTYGELFGSADTSEYLGIALWLEFSPQRAGSSLKVMLGRMSGSTYWPSQSVGFYTAEIKVPSGGYKGYVYLPFDSFQNLTGAVLDVKNKPNFIAFKYVDGAPVESDTYLYDLQLYRANTGEKEPEKPKTYQYVPSSLFNGATQDMWNHGRTEGGVPAVRVQQEPGNIPAGRDRSFVFHTDKNSLTSHYPGVYFWEESGDMKSRASFGNLFGKTSNREYDGIRLWLKTGEEHYDSLYVIYGRMSGSTYWPGNGFYTAKVEIPYEGLDGYVHIPFDSMLNSVGLSYNDVRKGNFIAFKYSDSTNRTTDLYISDLALYKEAEDTGANHQTGDDGTRRTVFGFLFITMGLGALLLQSPKIYDRKGCHNK